MIRALTTSATALEAQQAKMENLSHDLANVNTDAYKRENTEFQDLMYETKVEAGGQLGATTQTPVGIHTGMGVKVGTAHKIFEQGPARMTYHPYDLMIEGKGFFPVTLPNGEVAYTRNGAFHIDATGRLQLANGTMLVPQITVPSNAVNVMISQSGEVKVSLPDAGEAVIGQIQLMTFQNEQGLSAQGAGIYRATLGSGPPTQGLPGENGIGLIQQGALEGSNVNVANSMVDMIATQRGYEMGAKAMKVVDEMWATTNNIK